MALPGKRNPFCLSGCLLKPAVIFRKNFCPPKRLHLIISIFFQSKRRFRYFLLKTHLFHLTADIGPCQNGLSFYRLRMRLCRNLSCHHNGKIRFQIYRFFRWIFHVHADSAKRPFFPGIRSPSSRKSLLFLKPAGLCQRSA